jgi:hypothetical protein
LPPLSAHNFPDANMPTIRLSLLAVLLFLGALGCSKGTQDSTDTGQIASGDAATPAASAAAAKKAREDRIVSTQHDFTVTFPSTPNESNGEMSGEKVTEFFLRSKAGDIFIVAVCTEATGADWYLSGVPNINGKITSFKKVEANGQKGVETVVETPNGACCRHWCFTVGPRTYYVICSAASRAAVYGEPATRFFASFSPSVDPSKK